MVLLELCDIFLDMEYSQQDVMDVITDFEKHDIPLSVFIIDMDWHILKSEKNTTSTGLLVTPGMKRLQRSIHS